MPATSNASAGDAVSSYIWREMIVSAAISGLLSAAFFAALFAGQGQISLFGDSGAAFDFVPQCFMIGLLGTIVPTLLTRGRVRRGEIDAAGTVTWPLLRPLAVRALLLGVFGGSFVAALATTALYAIGPQTYSFALFLTIKVIVGIAWGAALTPFVIRMALSDGPSRK